MKRIELFEFEDQEWFPDWMRIAMTKVLVVMNQAMGTDIAIANLIQPLLKRNNTNQIVDLGSGAGGAMPSVLERIDQNEGKKDIKLLLTDLYPNEDAIQKFKETGRINYLEESVDATQLTQAPSGVRTIINAFHHLPPDKAKSILKSATESKEPLLVFEMADNNIPTIGWALFLPIGLTLVFIMALIFTPFSKPSIKQLIFTYLIPIIPICYAWDGQASYARIYASSDLDILLEGIEVAGYQWTKGFGEGKNGKKVGTYFIGETVI